MAEPTIVKELETVRKTLELELDAFVFKKPNHVFIKSDVQHFTYKQFNLIIDLNGRCEIDEFEVNVETKYHDGENEPTAAQTERKLKPEKLLSAPGIKVNQHIPCVPDTATVKPRTRREKFDRAYKLLVIAAKGEGMEQFHLEKTVRKKN